MKIDYHDIDAKYGSKTTYPLPWNTAVRLIDRTTNPVIKLIFIIGFNTGLRSSDIQAIKWMHLFDFETFQARERIFLTERKTRNRKNNKRRKITFNEYVQMMVKKTVIMLRPKKSEYFASYYLTSAFKPIPYITLLSQINNEFRKNRIEVKGAVGTHIMRKTFASRVYDLYDAKKPGSGIVMASKILGHRNIQTTMTYLGFTALEMDEIYEGLYGGLEDLRENEIKKIRNYGKKEYTEWPLPDEEE